VAGRIRQEDIEAVRERTDIAKVVSGYLALRKAGHDSLVGICPFHTEKTPSFSVSPSKGVYYCFGCGAGGDAVKFLEQLENLTFREAVERLAQGAGVTLRYEAESAGERRAASRREALHRANADAAGLFHRTLAESPDATDARAYLAGRGIDRETSDRFEIGFAPPSQNFLLRALTRSASAELLIEAGLASRDAAGGVRDRFRDRITFPIHDLSGRAVAFGARLVKDVEGQPKYLNSRETDVYKKGHVLYNLHRAKAALTRGADAFVVEGYTDVIALYQAGIETAVATCGTALGENHFRLLSRFGRRAILAFDSDEAGHNAAARAYELHQAHPLEVRVLVMPEGLDPADFVRHRGPESFVEIAKAAIPLIQFMLTRTLTQFDLTTVDGRTRASNECMPLLDAIRDSVAQEQYAHYVADRIGVSDGAIMAKIGRAAVPAPAAQATAETPVLSVKLSPQHRVEWEMLKLLARSSDLFETFGPELGSEHFDRTQHRKLLDLLASRRGDVRALIAETTDERLVGQLAALATEPLEGEPSREYADRVALRLKEFDLKRRIDSVRKVLERLNPIENPQEYEPMFVELSRLEGARRRVREQAERP
jgi:DNA primase